MPRGRRSAGRDRGHRRRARIVANLFGCRIELNPEAVAETGFLFARGRDGKVCSRMVK
jgi:hypothetical protein